MVKKIVLCSVFCLLLLFLSFVGVYAESVPSTQDEPCVEEAQISEELSDFLDAIPPELVEFLPETFFSGSADGLAAGVREAGSFEAILGAVGRVTGLSVSEHLSLLFRICGILLLSAVLRTVSSGDKLRNAPQKALSFCTVLCIFLTVLSGTAARFTEIRSFFGTMGQLLTALIPLMGVLYAMGGNIGAAVANQGVLTAFLTVLEVICSGTVLPVAGVCLSLALLDAVSGGVSLKPLSSLIKRTYTLGFSLLMLLLCGVLGIQKTLASGSDTLALRTVRFAAGSFLPVVGGSVSEALRTVAGSVTYLRATVGSGSILVLFFVFLPIFISVALTRITLSLCGAAAALLSCEAEEKILSELSSVYGYFLSVLAALFVMAVFSLTLFAHCATAG